MPPMKSLQSQVTSLFAQALRSAFPTIEQQVVVTKGNPQYGDFQCNNAMGIFRDYGRDLNLTNAPAVGEAIKAKIPANDILSDVVVGGPGFVTVKVRQEWLEKQIQILVKGEVEYQDLPRKRVVVDFSSPNVAKDMHVGHLRSTIIGETTSRILEFCGHEVHRLNHIGDWGTQFGMLIEYMKETYPKFREELPAISDLQEFYKAAKKKFDNDTDFKERARLRVVDLQSGGEESRMAWQKIVDVSQLAYSQIYKRLDITIRERGESYYNGLIPPIVEDLKARGLCVESDGAMCVFTPRVAEIPLMAVKSDGGYGYDSTDLAAVYHRLFMMRADWVVYITDLGQEQHFHMIFDAAEQAGWHRPPATRLNHMGFGLVCGEDGKKFRSRDGDTVKLMDLLNEAEERALEQIKQRVADQGDEAYLKTAAEQKDAATKLGIAAIRYFDMKQNRTSNYIFSYERMLDQKGNSAVFLFYAYTRIRAIQRKTSADHNIDISKIDAGEFKIVHPAERELALKICKFPDTIEAILGDLHLHQLTDYLWEICQTFTTFVTNCRVAGEVEMKSRLLLCEATRKVLFRSFSLLGFTPLEKM